MMPPFLFSLSLLLFLPQPTVSWLLPSPLQLNCSLQWPPRCRIESTSQSFLEFSAVFDSWLIPLSQHLLVFVTSFPTDFFTFFFVFCFLQTAFVGLSSSIQSIMLSSLAFLCLLCIYFQDNAYFSLALLVVRTGDLVEQRGFSNHT